MNSQSSAASCLETTRISIPRRDFFPGSTPNGIGPSAARQQLGRISADRLVVTESGILAPADVALMTSRGVHAFDVGDAFMRAPSLGA